MSLLEELEQECEKMANGNFEFSWIEREYNGISLMPKVRRQEDNSCVFQAMCAGTEMAIKRDAASKSPPATSDIEFNTSSFVEDYENRMNCKIGEEPRNLPVDLREETARTLFRNSGVLATSSDWEGQRRIKLSQCLKQRLVQFDRIADHIRRARPVVGSLPIDIDFPTLGPDEIYQFPGSKSVTIDYSHMVLFVGYGFEGGLGGKKYLVFLNSYGEEFGDRGFGRVYFNDIFRKSLYVLYANVPRFIQDLNASTSASKRGPTEDQDDRPAQRQRLSGEDSGSSVGGQHPPTLPDD